MTTRISTIEQLENVLNNTSLLQMPAVVMPGGPVFFTNIGFHLLSSGDTIFVCRNADGYKFIFQCRDVDCDGIFYYTWVYKYDLITELIDDIEIFEVNSNHIYESMKHYAASEYFNETFDCLYNESN